MPPKTPRYIINAEDWEDWEFPEDAGIGLQSNGVCNIGYIVREVDKDLSYAVKVLRWKPFGLGMPLQLMNSNHHVVSIRSDEMEEEEGDLFEEAVAIMEKLLEESLYASKLTDQRDKIAEQTHIMASTYVSKLSDPEWNDDWENSIVWCLDDVEEEQFYVDNKDKVPMFPPMNPNITYSDLNEWLKASKEAKKFVEI